MSFGVGFGLIIGQMFDNIGFGLAMGHGISVVMGLVIENIIKSYYQNDKGN